MKNSKKKKSLSDFSLLNSDKVVTNVNAIAGGGQEQNIKSDASFISSEQEQKQDEAPSLTERKKKAA